VLSTVQIQNQDGVVIATLPAEIDLSNIGDVRAQLLAGLQSPASTALIIDFSSSTYLDSKGIQLLMELEQFMDRSRQPFRLVVAPESPMARLLEITGVPVPRHESVAVALQQIHERLRTTRESL
jgi:anti-anti-sigma factor